MKSQHLLSIVYVLRPQNRVLIHLPYILNTRLLLLLDCNCLTRKRNRCHTSFHTVFLSLNSPLPYLPRTHENNGFMRITRYLNSNKFKLPAILMLKTVKWPLKQSLNHLKDVIYYVTNQLFLNSHPNLILSRKSAWN